MAAAGPVSSSVCHDGAANSQLSTGRPGGAGRTLGAHPGDAALQLRKPWLAAAVGKETRKGTGVTMTGACIFLVWVGVLVYSCVVRTDIYMAVRTLDSLPVRRQRHILRFLVDAVCSAWAKVAPTAGSSSATRAGTQVEWEQVCRWACPSSRG